MTQNKLTLFIDLLIFLVCIAGVYQVAEKADLPFHFEDYGSSLTVGPASRNTESSVSTGDIILKVEEIPVNSRDEIEIILDGMTIGQTAHLSILRNTSIVNEEVTLTKFYSWFYILCVLISGIIFFIVAVTVLIKSPKALVSKVFHWVVTGTGVIIMTTWGNYSVLPISLSHLTRGAFHFAYAFVPVCFLHFTFLFPKENYFRLRKLIPVLYAISLILFSAVHLCYYLFFTSRISGYIDLYSLSFNFSRFYIILCVLAGIMIFVKSYRSALTTPEKKKLKWIFFSLIIGPGSFILFWVIPQAVLNYGLIPEDLIILLMMIVPVGFGIAIIRHHIFDIDHIINRSLVYSALLGGIAMVYLFTVYIAALLFPGATTPAVSILITAFIGLLFAPVKEKVQLFVDKKFFRVRYNFRLASTKLLEGIKDSGDINALAKKVVHELNNIIPVDKSCFLVYEDNSALEIKASQSTGKETSNFCFQAEKILLKAMPGLSEASAAIEKVEAGSVIKPLKSFPLASYKINLIFPVKSSDNLLLGLLAIGNKRSGHIFTIEDIDLYNEVVLESGISIEKMRLNELLIKKQLEEKKLIELNELKSFFLSSVTHDLKTPVTSIKLFAELLEYGENIPAKQKEEYPAIIIGECGRLTRLIDNILDLTKIEKGIKEYHFELAELNEIVRYSVNIMSYQLKLEKCCLNISYSEDECFIHADPDSIISAMVNLISNAIKYSISPKKISICVSKEMDKAIFRIFNNCIPLKPEEIEHLGQAYFRANSGRSNTIPGTGLGLYLVGQILQAHDSTIKASYDSGKGLLFTISIPLWRSHAAENTYN
ncbi:MAG: ATP-binding protein [Bacillota bacterium]